MRGIDLPPEDKLHIKMEPLKNLSTWRKMAVATWRAADDPTIYGRMEVDMSAVLKFAAEMTERHGVKVTPTHCVARGVALALKHYPKANAIVRVGRIYLRKEVNVFLQVAIRGEDPDLSGVCVRNADLKKVHEIASELAEKAKSVRENSDPQLAKAKKSLNMLPFFLFRPVLKFLEFIQYTMNINPKMLGLPEDPFGSVMITSVGMLGIDEAFAPLVPISRVPIIVTVGEIKDKPVAVDGQVVIRPVCVITGTFDHKIIDGVQGAILAKFLKDYLANPWKFE